MIALLEGTVEHTGKSTATLLVGGVGFLVQVPERTVPTLAVGSTVRLFTHMAVREDDISLFGFASPQDREFFRLLISISGIGPKAALSILSSFDSAVLLRHLLNNDEKSLTKVPGIGAKTAKRLCLELSEKVRKMAPSAEMLLPDTAEVEEILTNLGCTADEAHRAVEKAVKSLGKEAGSDALLSESLRILSLEQR